MSPDGCSDCAAGAPRSLQRLGLLVPDGHRTVALAGTPNTGKTTLFNALTGLRQHVGNWPGTTVTRAVGGYRYDGQGYRVLDLPGTYTLDSASPDEEVAREAIFLGAPDVVLVVADATRLPRALPLVLQVRELAPRVVLALNLVDEAERHGVVVDVRHLRRDLDVPTVPIAARTGRGLPELMAAVAQAARAPAPATVDGYLRDPELVAAISDLAGELRREFPGLVRAEWVARKLLEGDETVRAAVRDGSVARAGAGTPPPPTRPARPARPVAVDRVALDGV